MNRINTVHVVIAWRSVTLFITDSLGKRFVILVQQTADYHLVIFKKRNMRHAENSSGSVISDEIALCNYPTMDGFNTGWDISDETFI